jgi:alpha-L-fucosidase 2
MIPTRRDVLRGGLALAAFPATAGFGFATDAESPNTLWYLREATRWLEALPIGNGRIGGMVFGAVGSERIALTESTVWSGAPSESDVNPGGLEHLQQIRNLLFQGDFAQARQLCEKNLLSHPANFGTNLPLLDLSLEMLHSANATQYRRSLNLDNAIARVTYRADGQRYLRESFCSNPDDVLVIHLACETPGQLSLSVFFSGIQLPGMTVQLEDNTLAFRGHAFETLHSDGKHGVDVECRVRVRAMGGRVTTEKDHLKVEGADSVTLLIAIATNYRQRDPARVCAEALEAASRKTYAELQNTHVADHQALFRRVHIDLGRTIHATSSPTDRRRQSLDKGADDPELCALFFQYGRYLTIAGSRANSPLPLALQGIWNDGLASSMGWTDDFHLDINTQQNYWVSEVGNLSESQTPLFALIDGLRISGARTAKQLYGAPGWVSHVVTNPWGYTAPGWGLGWGIFVTSGIWIALQMWEHFRFTGDREFLRERVYPVFKEAAEFFLAYMVEHPTHGWLVTGPSDSPENSFRIPNSGTCSESMGPTCDRVLVHALFTCLLESDALLSIDSDFGVKLKQARDKLPPLQIGRYGQLQEWLEDFEEAEPNHRHTSHLIALYPEHQISPEKTPALVNAARVTLERRIHQPNWEDTEWSRANLVNYYARLWDAEAAHKHLIGLIAKASDDNLLTYSRGGVAGAAQNIFSLDGNTAGAAGIAEMLLQSQGEAIHLLPALPSAWPEGSVRGLCARGGFEVEMRWRSGALVSAAISGPVGASCAVHYREKTIPVRVESGGRVRLTAQSFRADRA